MALDRDLHNLGLHSAEPDEQERRAAWDWPPTRRPDPREVSPLDHERNWDQRDALRADLNELRRTLRANAEQLAEVAGVPSLIVQRPST